MANVQPEKQWEEGGEAEPRTEIESGAGLEENEKLLLKLRTE